MQYELNLDRLRKARKKVCISFCLPSLLRHLLNIIKSLMPIYIQRLGVTSTRRDAEFGIQDRVHSLYKVLMYPQVQFLVRMKCSITHLHVESRQEVQGEQNLSH